jgi:uncharacterized integral membrane protein
LRRAFRRNRLPAASAAIGWRGVSRNWLARRQLQQIERQDIFRGASIMRAILRLLQWILFLLVAFVVVTFVVQNRQEIDVSLWPLPFTKPAPLFAIIIACVLVGFLLGAFSAWLSGGGARKRARELARMNEEKARQIAQLHRDLAVQKQSGPQPKPPSITHAA